MISDKFLENTKGLPPSRILVEAMPYVKENGHALDLGAGAFKDTFFLLEKGFKVDAIDKADNVAELAPEAKAFHFFLASYEDYDFPIDTYDLVNAQYSLPFCSPEYFLGVWQKIKESLKSGGIFAGQFFGPADGFAPDDNMTFLDKAAVEDLLRDFKVHTFVEAKRTSKTATDRKKFWHVFDVIAEKR